MGRPPLEVVVSAKDQKYLTEPPSSGVQQVRLVPRALALLQSAKGVSAPRISGVVPLGRRPFAKSAIVTGKGAWNQRCTKSHALGAAALLDDSQKQRIIAMVCSAPPEGRTRWTVRLVAEEAVKRKLVPGGRETIRLLLYDLKPWRETNVVRPGRRLKPGQ